MLDTLLLQVCCECKQRRPLARFVVGPPLEMLHHLAAATQFVAKGAGMMPGGETETIGVRI